MQNSNTGRETGFVGPLALLIVCALSTGACEPQRVGAVDSRSHQEETWTGVVSSESDQAVRVELHSNPPIDFEGASPGESASYTFRFDSPRACELTLSSPTRDANALQFRVKGASGGYCDRLFKKLLRLERQDSGKVRAQIPTQSDLEESALLTRATL